MGFLWALPTSAVTLVHSEIQDQQYGIRPRVFQICSAGNGNPLQLSDLQACLPTLVSPKIPG